MGFTYSFLCDMMKIIKYVMPEVVTMKACVIQPPYSKNLELSDEHFAYKLRLLEECDESIDIIVLPEYSDVPCATTTMEETLLYHNKYIETLLEKCSFTAKRCKAYVFVNALSKEQTGWRNTTYCFDRKGQQVGKYFKNHLPIAEQRMGLDCSYAMTPQDPYILELDGIRFGFLTCYDFYFYEYFARLAQEKPDIIIGCSLQRSDSHAAIETMCRFLAYNTNAYVLRASVSFDENADVCGASMIVSPEGEVLANMEGRFGIATAEFDPSKKYLKAGGFGNPPAAHWEYMNAGRKPWLYRNGGASAVLPDSQMPYPRVCAHRGFNTIAPENSMPAFGAAVAMGAEEIEFDVWHTKDGVLVSCHDKVLDRVSNGHGNIYEYSYADLLELDFGINFGENFKGLKIPTFEEILQKFSGRVIMNIHVKIWDFGFPVSMMEEIVELIRKYDVQDHVYLMTINDQRIREVMSYAPDIRCCVGWDGNKDPMSMVDRAIALGAYKIQLFKPYFNAETVKKAHEHGIICNVFWSDDPEETKEYRKMGIETILTNNYNLISQVVER